jgi:hypothetical protein
MKRALVLLLLLVLTFEGVAQRKDRKVSLTYEETQSSYAQMTKYGKTQQYISKAGAILNVGDTIFLREANRGLGSGYYTTIFAGDPYDGGRQTLGVLIGYYAVAVEPLAVKRGEATVIEKIRWFRERKRPVVIQLCLRPISGKVSGAATFFVKDVELAFDYREIYHKSLPLSRDDLIQELRKAKDELDLGLINQDEFEAIKAEILRKLDEIEMKEIGT